MISKELKQKIQSKLEKHLDFAAKVEFYDQKYSPDVTVNMGQDCFYNNENDTITIGLYCPVFEWCESLEDEYRAATYVNGHEIQHRKSTSNKAWNYGIKRGVEYIIEHLSKENKIPIVFRHDKDYERAVSELEKKGYHLKMGTLIEFVHGILNSLEDGRIERIRAFDDQGFLKVMKEIRLRIWDDNFVPEGDAKEMNPVKKMMVITNQILSLATTGYYEKGFTLEYDGSDVKEYVDDLIPNITKAVIAKTCKECAEQSIIICQKLADVISEASKMTDFEKSIKELFEKLKKTLGDKQPATCSEREEQTGNGKQTLVFKESDLFSDDEKSDETKDSGQDNSQEEEDCYKIKSKKEKESEKDSAKNPSESSDNQNSETSEEGDKADEGTSGSESTSEEGNMKNTSLEKAEQGGKREKSEGKSKAHALSQTAGECSKEEADARTKEIQEEMKKAAEEAAGISEGVEENIEQTLQRTVTMQEGEAVTEPLTPMDVDEIKKKYNNHYQFKEMERSYEVNSPMPPVLCMEIQKMQKQLEPYLRKKKAKKLRNRYSGSLDSEKVGMLAANQIDIFKESKINKGVSACALLMVDNSGSMGHGKGSKRYHANIALSKAEMTLGKYFPIKIFAYDEASAIIHEVIKNWGEKFPMSSAYNFLIKGRSGCGNMDGFSIRVATQDILSRPEKRKLMVILSDGLPDDINDVRDAVEEARKRGIKVVAIYFSDYPDHETEKTFGWMYQKDYIITEPENIGEELIKGLKGFFL